MRPCKNNRILRTHHHDPSTTSHSPQTGPKSADYRLPLNDGKEIHLKEYDYEYLGHWDFASAIKNPIMHLVKDSPGWLIAGAIVGLVVGGIALALKDSSNKEDAV